MLKYSLLSKKVALPITKNNTKVREGDLYIPRVVTLYGTDVVTVRPDGVILLNTGGFFTRTTMRRMNQASEEWDLGYFVISKGGRWVVDYQGQKIPFIGKSVTLNDYQAE